MNTMKIKSIQDLKNRTLVESNILKSFILSDTRGYESLIPSLDDLLLHDYQIANSITINQAMSSMIVGMKGIRQMLMSGDFNSDGSYFQIVDDSSFIEDSAKLILSTDTMSFSMHGLVMQSKMVDVPSGTSKFFNLSNRWYGLVVNQFVHNMENDNGNDLGVRDKDGKEMYSYEIVGNGETDLQEVICYDQIKSMDEMNPGSVNALPNLFDDSDDLSIKRLYCEEQDGNWKKYKSFNTFMRLESVRSHEQKDINCIVENLFFDESASEVNVNPLFTCQYILCTSFGLFGLSRYKGEEGQSDVDGFKMYYLKRHIPNLNDDQEYSTSFHSCDFITVGEQTTMVVTFQGKDGIIHCLYLQGGKDEWDNVYGFRDVKNVVSDGLSVDMKDVVSRIDSFKELDTVSIAMTDNGFWDVEPNGTRNITRFAEDSSDRNYERKDGSEYNRHESKIVDPLIHLSGSDVVTEYDVVWRQDGINHSNDGIKYPSQLSTGQIIAGATSNFAVYQPSIQVGAEVVCQKGSSLDSIVCENGTSEMDQIINGIPNSANPIMMIRMDEEMFSKLLLQTPDLKSLFLQYLYEQVTYPERGEHYLKGAQYSAWASGMNSRYTIHPGEYEYPYQGNLPARFNSISSLADSDNGLELQGMCERLDSILNGSKGIEWLFGKDDSSMSSEISNHFKDHTWNNELANSFADSAVDGFLDGFSVLTPFRDYLQKHVRSDFVDTSTMNVQAGIDDGSVQLALTNVSEFIKSKIPASLVLGGYDTTKSGNERYPGLSSYIDTFTKKLQITDVQRILSPTNVYKEVYSRVKKIPMFTNYDDLEIAKGDSDLFKTTDLPQDGFLGISKFIGSNKINVNWDSIKNWVDDGFSDENILRAFIRTQIYRPLFFKHDDHSTFTSDSSRYFCRTDKYFVNHLGDTVKFTMSDGVPNITGMSLENINSERYDSGVNKIQYTIDSGNIPVSEEHKFVHDDVEYFLTFNDSGNPANLYFNDFVKETPVVVEKIQPNGSGIYTINGVDYKIQDNAMVLAESPINGEEAFYSEIVGGGFMLHDVWYKIDTTDHSISAQYEWRKSVIQLPITELGQVLYGSMTFNFNSDGSEVSISRIYHADVIDRVSEEWCEFDDESVEIGDNKTFKWWIARQIVKLYDECPSSRERLYRLGNGLMYSGSLDSNCKVRIQNDIQTQNVITQAFADIHKPNGSVETISLETIISDKFDFVPGKVIYGALNDGIIVEDNDDYDSVFILIDSGSGRNNLNSVKIGKEEWLTKVQLRQIGTFTTQGENNETIVFDEIAELSGVSISVFLDSINVDTRDSEIGYIVKRENDIASFVANGDRYLLDFNARTISKFEFSELNAHILDFSTEYGKDEICRSISRNLMQFMLGYIVNAICTSDESASSTISISPERDLNLYLDMFSDVQQSGNFSTASNYDVDSPQARKFQEVFKNNSMSESSTDDIINGNIYSYLKRQVDSAFTVSGPIVPHISRTMTLVNDRPAWNATRSSGNADVFSYEVQMDLSCRLNKQFILNELSGVVSSNHHKYIPANAVLKDVRCKVEITPKLDDDSVKYDVKYTIVPDTYQIQYDRVFYWLESGSVKQISVPLKTGTFELPSTWLPCSKTDQDISDLNDSETIEQNIEQLFTNEMARGMLIEVDANVSDGGEPIVVKVENQYNKKIDGSINGVWGLGQSIPSQYAEIVNRRSRGKAIIGGMKYHVNDNDDGLVSDSIGASNYDIKRVAYTDGDARVENTIIVSSTEVVPLDASQYSLQNIDDELWIKCENTSRFIGEPSKVELTYTDGQYGDDPVTSTSEAITGNFVVVDGSNPPEPTTQNLGPDLSNSGRFSVSFDSESTSESITIIPCGSVDQGDDNHVPDYNWKGRNGSITIQFSNINTDNPSAEIQNPYVSPISVDNIPSSENRVQRMRTYIPQRIVEIEKTVSDSNTVVSFKVQYKVEQKYLCLIPSSPSENYHHFSGIFISYSSNDAGYNVEYGIPCYDCNNSVIKPSDGIKYAIAKIPTNLGVEGEKMKYMTCYFTWSVSGDNYSVDGGTAKECPFTTIYILPPNQARTEDSQIYDRYYVIRNEISVSKLTRQITNDSALSSGDVEYFLRDNSKIVNSIRCTMDDGVKFSDFLTDGNNIPQSMKDELVELRNGILHLSKEHFEVSNEKLWSFLNDVQNELNLSLDADDIKALATLKFSPTLIFGSHSTNSNDWMSDNGLFKHSPGGSDELSQSYSRCLDDFNGKLLSEFISDFGQYNFDDGASGRNISGSRTYYNIVKYGGFGESSIKNKKDSIISSLYGEVAGGDSESVLPLIFENNETRNRVRWINTVDFSVGIGGTIKQVAVIDGTCNMFIQMNNSIQWYQFQCDQSRLEGILNQMAETQGGRYRFTPSLVNTDFAIDTGTSWCLRALNRDYTIRGEIQITDSFAVPCVDGHEKMWYVKTIDAYFRTADGLVDMAYDDGSDSVYAIFNDDVHVYAFNSVSMMKDSQKRVMLRKNAADMKIETFHSVNVTDLKSRMKYIYLDYEQDKDGKLSWSIKVYGEHQIREDGRTETFKPDIETWSGNPGGSGYFVPYNNVVFGDSLFTENQLRFQNISKHKDMYDVIDVNEVDGCYYGLFRDSNQDNDEYVVFKIGKDDGIVERLPWKIVCPMMLRTSDDLYTLYVVAQDEEAGTIHLQEISVPDSDLYASRRIPIQKLIGAGDDFMVNDIIADGFIHDRKDCRLFVLSNYGFHELNYVDDMAQLSIDTLDGFKDALSNSLSEMVNRHESEMHSDGSVFGFIKDKVNQFASDFSIWSLIPTEFSATQDVGVVPPQKIDDTDESTDHRADSIVVSTDILQKDGMVVSGSDNPGLVTCAVSNPATMYEDDNVFTKSQRNPSIEGTEFYDYIYDQDGNQLMDLYAIPFIYQIHSNNTYDLYINVPTTRTKYLNRVAGTLKPDGTTQVLNDDSRIRRNLLNESIPNNLDESTTKLRVYIDRKFISIGNVELVEISGNSIPQKIYRDVVNDGLYDSIALESRWNGEVVEILEPSKDINKVMLEFEVYGTDSQSIHITGRTLVNDMLNDGLYKFG